MTNKKKVFFITGSSSGIGFELAKKFLDLGFEIIINSNNIRNLKRASKLLNNCKYFFGDLTNIKSLQIIFNQIKKKYKKIDFLVCNYGNSNFKKNHLDFDHAFRNNFFTTVNSIRFALPILKENKSKIICISSICGVEIIKNSPLGYSIAKSAINNYVKGMSCILAEKGISINAVAPGNVMFQGSLWYKKIKGNPINTKKYIKENVPMNKFALIEDIFGVIRILLSQESNFITGCTYIVDGGQTKRF
jgi:NAD(P)-dependent dehydrogenase (short-subunit alcohol dehydrogenase family)